MKTFAVYVYNHRWSDKPGTKNRPLAYTTYQTPGACIHKVEAVSGYEAKKQATKEHVANPACSQEDPYRKAKP